MGHVVFLTAEISAQLDFQLISWCLLSLFFTSKTHGPSRHLPDSATLVDASWFVPVVSFFVFLKNCDQDPLYTTQKATPGCRHPVSCHGLCLRSTYTGKSTSQRKLARTVQKLRRQVEEEKTVFLARIS